MRLLLICTEMLPVPCIRGGAIQTYIDGILPFLAVRHAVTVYSVADPDLPPSEERAGVQYVRFPAETPTNYYRSVARSLEVEHFDWVVIYNRPKYVPHLVRAGPRARFLLSMHNEMFLPGKLDADVAEACLAQVEQVVTVSQFVANGIAELYPRYAGKVQPIYSGVDTDLFRPYWEPDRMQRRASLREEHRLTGKQVVLNVGRLSEKKGVHMLLPAMKQVLETHPNAVLLIVGSKWYGSDEPDRYVHRLMEVAGKLGDAVRFTGFVVPGRMPDLYLLGDLFVCASQWQEPLARVHYEAMAAGLPIITTARGGNPDVMEPEKNGLLIREYDNPAAFAEGIRLLLDRPDLAAEMGRYGRGLAETKYTWARVAADLLRILEG